MKEDVLKLLDKKQTVNLLEKYYADVVKGIGKTILVTGETGIGKSTIIENFALDMGKKGATYLKGRCLYQGKGDPFLPFISALVNHEKKKMIYRGGLEALIIPTRDGFDKSVKSEENYKFNDIIENIEKNVPIIVFIDDLNRADTSSLNLFLYLAQKISDKKIMLIGTDNTDQPLDKESEDFLNILEIMKREKLHVNIELQPFNKEDLSELLRDSYENLPDEIIDIIYNESEGNPYFAFKMIEHLINDDRIDEEGKTSSISDAILDLKDYDYENYIISAYHHLDDLTKNVAKHASIIGKQFDLNVLRKIININEGDLVDTLDILIEHKIIREIDEDNYSFQHLYICKAIYNKVNSAKKKYIEQKVAEMKNTTR